MRSVATALLVTALAVAVLAGLALAVGTCGSGDAIDRQPLTIVTANGTSARLEVEIADTEPERTKGLSGRTEVPNDTGMLFVFPEPGPGFWMKDTLVDLSVAFIAHCGQIVSIQDMQANTLDVHQADAAYEFGLEVPQGWFQRNGVAIGDIVSLPAGLRPGDCQAG